jgi:hypothetical protein
MRSQADGHAPSSHVCSDFQDFLASAEKNNVDGEIHSERVYRFAGNDPKPFTRIESLMFQETRPAAAAVAGYGNFVPEKHTSCFVSHLHYKSYPIGSSVKHSANCDCPPFEVRPFLCRRGFMELPIGRNPLFHETASPKAVLA